MTIETVNFHFDQPSRGVSLDRLDELERELGGKIDSDFRSFLGKLNGGYPSPALVSSYPELAYPIVVFLGCDEQKSNLICDHRDLSQTLGRSDLLPIAYDRSLSRICLKIGLSCSPVILVSVDELYYREAPRIEQVCDSFIAFWDSLSQPESESQTLEQLAEQPWRQIQMQIKFNLQRYLEPHDELSLLCQVIRAENDEAFLGLIENGASLIGALKIAVNCERLDYVRKLVERGASPSEGIPYAVGPSRRQIREFLENHS